EAPSWAMKIFVIAVALGFAIALVLAWAFERTAEGIKRTETADAMPTPRGEKKRAWIYLVVVGGLLSIGLFLLGRYTASTKQTLSTDAPAKSIAVLPFDNLSEEKGNAY